MFTDPEIRQVIAATQNVQKAVQEEIHLAQQELRLHQALEQAVTQRIQAMEKVRSTANVLGLQLQSLLQRLHNRPKPEPEPTE